MAAENARPLAPDGTTDWEAVFEDEKSGLIPLIGQAHTTEALRACAFVVMQKLFTRKTDQSEIRKLTAELDRVIADSGDSAGLAAAKEGVTKVLRQVKENQKRKTAAYAKSKRAKKGGDRRISKTGGRAPIIGKRFGEVSAEKAAQVHAKQSKRSVREQTGQTVAKKSVATTIHVSRETLELLRDVALARELAHVADASSSVRIRIKARDRTYSVSSVIEDLIERHRAGLEAEAELLRGRPRGT